MLKKNNFSKTFVLLFLTEQMLRLSDTKRFKKNLNYVSEFHNWTCPYKLQLKNRRRSNTTSEKMNING